MVALSLETQLVLSWTLPALATYEDVTVMDFIISWRKTGGTHRLVIFYHSVPAHHSKDSVYPPPLNLPLATQLK